MNINKFNSNKSNLKIAPDICFPFLSLSFTNNNRNNINHNNNSSRNLIFQSGNLPSSPLINLPSLISNKFVKTVSSSLLDEISHIISIASLNVKGFVSNIFKFDAIINDLFNKDMGVRQ